ncbi:LysR family transcriptional regulator [Burkholderia pseudomultivorans]|uniref:LysR family transcriptional regulator n=2 Tax=Burkholderia pseudomultivorans TaxID=1207504 RepID=UPI0012DA1A32|nr:LysR family transcriptional regulator [Burkholderia pseudomultivorans]
MDTISLIHEWRALFGIAADMLDPAHTIDDMKLKHLRALQVIAESGSIQEASRRLCLTQPAVSRIVREFESELGLPLLIRTTRGATLTEYADLIVRRAGAIHREIERIGEYVDEIRGMLNGRLSIAVSAPTMSTALIDTLADFANERPHVDLQIREMRTQQIEDSLRDGTTDVGVLTHFGDQSVFPYQAELLYQGDMVLAISSCYAGPTSLSLSALQKMPWLTLDLVQDDNSFISVLMKSAGLPLPERIIRSTATTMYRGIARRVGAVSIWTASGSDFLQRCFAEGGMRRITVADPMPRMSVRLAYRDRDLMTTPARDFALWLRNKVERDGFRYDARDIELQP